MITIEKQLNELINQKNALASVLKNNGVSVNDTETFNTLIPKVNELSGGGGLNIHFGDEPPEDTSMLWVKWHKPAEVIVNPTIPTIETLPFLGSLKYAYTNYRINASAYENYIYIFGGRYYRDDIGTYYLSSNIEKYNVNTGTTSWLSTTLPGYLYSASACTVGNYIYLFACEFKSSYSGTDVSGIHPTSSIYRFNPSNGTTSLLSVTLPSVPPSMCAVVAIGTDIYIFASTTEIYKFDTVASAVTTLSVELPGIPWRESVVLVGTDIYFRSGGTSIYKFDTLTNITTTLSVNLSVSLSSDSMSSIGTDIFIFGQNNKSSYIYKLDTVSQKIYQLCKSTPPVQGSAIENIDGNIYLLSGFNYSSQNYTSYVRKFTDTPLDTDSILIRQNLDTNMVKLINDDTKLNLGITCVYHGNLNSLYSILEAYLYKDGVWTLI